MSAGIKDTPVFTAFIDCQSFLKPRQRDRGDRCKVQPQLRKVDCSVVGNPCDLLVAIFNMIVLLGISGSMSPSPLLGFRMINVTCEGPGQELSVISLTYECISLPLAANMLNSGGKGNRAAAE